MTAQVLIQQVLLKRGNSAVASAYVGPIGEVVVDTDLLTLRVQDASEPGGYLVATEAFVDAQVNVITAGIPNLVGNLIANTIPASDRLVNGVHELVLNVGGAGPYVTFPADEGAYISIQGCDIGGVGFEVNLLSAEDGVRLSANATSDRKDWLFGTDGTLTVPLPAPITFTATLSPIYHGGGDEAWSVPVTFMPYANGTVEVIIGEFGASVNPGYQSADEWTYTEADHAIPGYTFTLSIIDIGYNNNPLTPFWSPTFGASEGPSYIQTIKPTIKSTSAIKLSADTNTWTFGADGVLTLPDGGTISYTPANPGDWNSPPPTTIQAALDRLAAVSPGA